ncbi:twin-arginine translocase TatA/TatE family subunit [Rubellicoccus peritrichatus]|uniref:Sec-independent protein translocase protein TatA n=1 Tax=Rubellicoccus peritrichatus TaxID=3080537 RepID=A0AAQ3QSB0_9BACT|nr:twin-arginine translocase TatA/TatE family subunit [Puniceicoccus sp. CR14]WOO42218.1 twin-arginine translocase TatA/TatE family subunit [Puniceicoccus sp. CR14]
MVTSLPNISLGFLQNLGPWEITLIVVLALLLFGGKKLPELARGAGKAIKEFRGATADAEKTFKDAMNEAEVAQKKPTDEPSKPAGNSTATS